MTMVDDRTTLNDMDVQGDVDQWTATNFDAITLNDTNQPTRLFREGGGSGEMILKANTDGFWTDDVIYDMTGGIQGNMIFVMWLWFSGPNSTTFLADILVGIYDGTGGQGGSGIGGRWNYKPIIEDADAYGWTACVVYPTQPDEEEGVFANIVLTSMDSIELDANNTSGSFDVKLAGMEACFIISYIGGHGQTVTLNDLLTHSQDKTSDRDFGVFFQSGDAFRSRVAIRLGDAVAAGDNDTIFNETAKVIHFDNFNSDHEIGFHFINDTSGATNDFTLTDCFLFWNSGLSTVFTGVANVDTWSIVGNTFLRGGPIELPANATGFVTNTNKFDTCGEIDIGDGVFEDNTVSNAVRGVGYVGSGTFRTKNNAYVNNTIAIRFDTAQTISVDGDTFSGNVHDVENNANATTQDSYAFTNQNADQQVGNGTIIGAGQSFTTDGSGGVLSNIRWLVDKTGSPTGNATAKVYTHSGTLGTSSIPTGAALATSNTLDVTTITSDASQVWQVDNTPFETAFVDQTTGFNDATSANFTPFPTSEAVDDYCAFGRDQTFVKLTFDSAGGTSGAAGVVAWQYWDGSDWTALAGVTDGTTSFTVAVADGQEVTWTEPSDWAARSLGTDTAHYYYVRAVITTVYSTNPVYDQGFVSPLVQFEFEDEVTLSSSTNYVCTVEYSGGDGSNHLLIGTDTSSPTHGGNFSTLTGSTWTAVSGTDAIFFVSTGGILTINTLNGANPTTDINTGSPPGATIINSAVNVTITCVDTSGSPIENVSVFVDLDTNPEGDHDAEIIRELTNASGIATETFNYVSEVDIVIRARKSDAVTRFFPVSTTGTIVVTGFALQIVMQQDNVIM